MLLLLATVPGQPGLAAQGAAPPRAAVMQEGELELDGRLTEVIWERAVPVTGLTQREPRAGRPARRPTGVWFAYDTVSLYVAIRAEHDPDLPLLARILREDGVMQEGFAGEPRFAGDDAVAVLLDPFRDRRNAVVLAVNPAGARFDALLSDDGGALNIEWDAEWYVATSVEPSSWTAEIRIPLHALAYPDPARNGRWGVNVYRIVQGDREEALWRGWSRDAEGFRRVSLAGEVGGFHRLPPPRRPLTIRPFLVARTGSRDAPEAGSGVDSGVDAGVDASWSPRPGLLADATVRPDFAQADVDPQQINLDRFPLFFPETRDFFLENAGIFRFGTPSRTLTPPDFLLFFSRQVGFSPEGPIPVLGGGRLSGRVGEQTVGVLDAVTDGAPGRPAENFSAVRLKRDVGTNGYVGVAWTDRRSAEGGESAGGLDASLWSGSTRVDLFGAVVGGFGTDRVAARAELDHQVEGWGLEASHLYVGEDARPAAGFVSQVGVHKSRVIVRRTVRPRVLGLRSVNLFAFGEQTLDPHLRLVEREVGPSMTFRWESGELLSLFATRGRLRVRRPFTLADTLPVDAREDPSTLFNALFRTHEGRTWFGELSATWREAFGGSTRTTTVSAGAHLGRHLSAEGSFGIRAADLPGGSFSAPLTSLRVDGSLDTRTTVTVVLQRDGLRDRRRVNARAAYLPESGREVFLVFEDVWNGRTEERLRRVLLKVAIPWRP